MTPRLVDLDVSLLDSSPTNPRKVFRGIEELAASITAQGLLEPVLARPMGSRFELVAGERRLRAVRLLGLPTIRAIVEERPPAQVEEAQLVENGQREDISALEEADAYAALRMRHGYTVEQIAERTGKPRPQVYKRLKLSELGPAGRAALERGEISATVATELARVPGDALQAEALEQLAPAWRRTSGEPCSKTDALRILAGFRLLIADAPFNPKDKNLVKDAGPCTQCPKRAGQQREDYPDLPANTCLDIGCWRGKVAALRVVHTQQAEAKGWRVASSEDARNLIVYGGTLAASFIDLDATCSFDKKRQSWAELVSGALAPVGKIKPTLAFEDNGRPRYLLSVVEARDALRAVGLGKLVESPEKPQSQKVIALRGQYEAEERAREQYRERLAVHVAARSVKCRVDNTGFWRVLAVELLDMVDHRALVLLERRRDWKAGTARERLLTEPYTSARAAALELLALDGACRPRPSVAIPKLLGINVEQLARAATKPAAKPSKAKPAAKASTKRRAS